jgi:hypothetical protein
MKKSRNFLGETKEKNAQISARIDINTAEIRTGYL